MSDQIDSRVSAREESDGAVDRVRTAYDAVAKEYAQAFCAELNSKPLDRGLLTSFLELCGDGVVADVGCGPGHVTRYLADFHPDVLGLDLSPEMIAVARDAWPHLSFEVASMLNLPAADAAWAGAILLYSIIHLTSDERVLALNELQRVIRPGGWLLVSFHVESDEYAAGDTNHLDSWFGKAVDLDGYFLAPEIVTAELRDAGFVIMSTMVREPWPETEYPSRRCYLLSRR